MDAILTASPYYNKPTQEGQYRHFRTIAEAVDKPIILYNVPGRTGTNLEAATVGRLLEVPNIAGVKEASGNIAQIAEICSLVPESFSVLSGDDAATLPVIAFGGVGVISVASNEIPREMADMTRAALNNDWATARGLNRKYLALMQANFIESSPLPVKAVLAMMGRIEEVYRLPLLPIAAIHDPSYRESPPMLAWLPRRPPPRLTAWISLSTKTGWRAHARSFCTAPVVDNATMARGARPDTIQTTPAGMGPTLPSRKLARFRRPFPACSFAASASAFEGAETVSFQTVTARVRHRRFRFGDCRAPLLRNIWLYERRSR